MLVVFVLLILPSFVWMKDKGVFLVLEFKRLRVDFVALLEIQDLIIIQLLVVLLNVFFYFLIFVRRIIQLLLVLNMNHVFRQFPQLPHKSVELSSRRLYVLGNYAD